MSRLADTPIYYMSSVCRCLFICFSHKPSNLAIFNPSIPLQRWCVMNGACMHCRCRESRHKEIFVCIHCGCLEKWMKKKCRNMRIPYSVGCDSQGIPAYIWNMIQRRRHWNMCQWNISENMYFEWRYSAALFYGARISQYCEPMLTD